MWIYKLVRNTQNNILNWRKRKCWMKVFLKYTSSLIGNMTALRVPRDFTLVTSGRNSQFEYKLIRCKSIERGWISSAWCGCDPHDRTVFNRTASLYLRLDFTFGKSFIYIQKKFEYLRINKMGILRNECSSM